MPNRLGIGSMSLGRPEVHDLPGKLHQAALHGYEGIELFFDDLDNVAKSLFKGDHIAAARHVRQLCDSLRLSIICLQPFWHYEGLLDRAEHSRLLTEKLPKWFELAHLLDTDLIQIPSNFLPADPETGASRTTDDRSLIVADLQEISDLGLQQSPPFRFVYEALAWGNHVNKWEESWEICKQVNRPNFGICLDTFNIAGRIYADPTCPTGKTPNAEADLQASLARLRSSIDLSKVFYVQIVDGERLSAPLDESHPFYVENQHPRMNWSRNARLFAFEEDRGGYLPVLDVAQAFFDLGFEGWVSLELFNRSLADPDPATPRNHARRGLESWKKLVSALKLDTGAPCVSGSDESFSSSSLSVQHRL
ncbi:xylose isomerase-like protein [Aspergillus leporis]|jgi:4-hydroxyphenylpyruvate dioxygenase|uniref:Xylose isomerase-like protein n=1 Tax=Aspergillus leporis TaxID=41062 RepID=A0A5N5WTD4_9EURO|nr:xylose isomerase-like protein [Aspergillus leporis]